MNPTDKNYIDPLFKQYFFDQQVKHAMTRGYPYNDFRRNKYYGTLTFRSKHSTVDPNDNKSSPVCPLGWEPSRDNRERELNMCTSRNETKGAFYTEQSEISKTPLVNPYGKIPYNITYSDEKLRINEMGRQYGF